MNVGNHNYEIEHMTKMNSYEILFITVTKPLMLSVRLYIHVNVRRNRILFK
jgi:hypothetical protein